MRLRIRAKQIAGVTAIVGLSVIAVTGLAVEVLSSFLMSESLSRGKMLANTIFQRAREVVPASADPYAGLRDDPGLRSILTSSLLGESVTYSVILNVEGVVIASGDPSLVSRRLPPAEDLEPIAVGNVIDQLR